MNTISKTCGAVLISALLFTLAGCEGRNYLTVIGNDYFPTDRGYENEHFIIDISLSGNGISLSIANKTIYPATILWKSSNIRLPQGDVYYSIPLKREATPGQSALRETKNVQNDLNYLDIQNSDIPSNSVGYPAVYQLTLIEDIAELLLSVKNHKPAKEVSLIDLIDDMVVGDMITWRFTYFLNKIPYNDSVRMQIAAPKAR